MLRYSPEVDYRLPEIPDCGEVSLRFNPYYVYYQVMGMSADLPIDATPETVLTRKREVISQICLANGVSDSELPNGYGFKRLKREIEAACAPLVQKLKERVSGNALEVMIDNIAQRYSPDSAQSVKETAQRIASVFHEIYSRRKHYGILMPKDQQLLTFFSQISQRVFGEKTEPLNMFVVACPRFGEHDEYDRLEEGLSQTASAYLYSLPLLTSALSKNGIPYRGYIFVSEADVQMADGSLLVRLGLTKETYRAKCRANVEAVNQAISEDARITEFSAHLLTEVLPDFIDVTANLEKQLYRLTQSDSNLRLKMAEVAYNRLGLHTKKMGGKCDFSESFYLSLHYSAQYMALGYLLRLYPQLSEDSIIVNSDSPNVERFNSQELLTRCLKGDLSAETISTIPVFQVKF